MLSNLSMLKLSRLLANRCFVVSHQQLVEQVCDPFLEADSITTLSQSSNDALLGFWFYEDADR